VEPESGQARFLRQRPPCRPPAFDVPRRVKAGDVVIHYPLAAESELGNEGSEDVSYEVNEPDAFALEEALRQKEKHTGEVVVVTAGPARALQVLREALAKGADRAIHLEDDAFVGLDAYNTARAIPD
jgi:hypothetical protein